MIKEIDPIQHIEWQSFIDNHPDSTIFHHPVWLKVLKKQYGFQPWAICNIKNDDKIVAGIVFCKIKSRMVSLPFTDFCPPLYDSEPNLLKILRYIKKDKQIKQIEIRFRVPDVSDFEMISRQVIHETNIEGTYDDIQKKFHKSQVLRNLKKAKKQDLMVERKNDKNSVDDFYDLHLQTRHKHGVPIQPKHFFYCIYDEVICKGKGFFIFIKMKQKFIAAAFFMVYNRKLIYKFGASDPLYLAMRPNHLIFDEAFRLCIENNYDSLNFGKTDNENTGLRNFKKYWGSEEKALIYSYYPYYKESKVILFISKNILKPFIQRSPLIITRILGEVLYKYVS